MYFIFSNAISLWFGNGLLHLITNYIIIGFTELCWTERNDQFIAWFRQHQWETKQKHWEDMTARISWTPIHAKSLEGESHININININISILSYLILILSIRNGCHQDFVLRLLDLQISPGKGAGTKVAEAAGAGAGETHGAWDKGEIRSSA